MSDNTPLMSDNKDIVSAVIEERIRCVNVILNHRYPHIDLDNIRRMFASELLKIPTLPNSPVILSLKYFTTEDMIRELKERGLIV